MIVEITNQNFEAIVLNNKKPIILDFWAPRCGPCKILNPYFDEFAEKYQDDIIIGKINVDDNSDVAAQFGIRGIPTILFIKDGKILDKQIGVTSKKALEDKLKSNFLIVS